MSSPEQSPWVWLSLGAALIVLVLMVLSPSSQKRKERHGTTGQAAFAMLEGLEAGLTFGLSPRLRAKGGLSDAEATSTRKESSSLASKQHAKSEQTVAQQATKQVHQGSPPAPKAAATTQAPVTTFVRGKEFLASKYPDAGVGLDGEKLEPSASAVAKYRRYVEAVENPAAVFEHARAGTLTAEHVEALREVYPGLFTQYGHVLLNSLGGTRAKPAYQQSQRETIHH